MHSEGKIARVLYNAAETRVALYTPDFPSRNQELIATIDEINLQLQGEELPGLVDVNSYDLCKRMKARRGNGREYTELELR
jgi:hypothetical protein